MALPGKQALASYKYYTSFHFYYPITSLFQVVGYFNEINVLYSVLCQGQSSTMRTLIMHAMADWYMRGEGDQSRLSRILDVAQDLKVRVPCATPDY